MFPNLKLQIFRLGSHQNQLAKAVGMDETVLSKIIHGYRAPTAEQRKLLSRFLAADEAWLFEHFETNSKPDGSGPMPTVAPREKAGENGGD
jgi:transcriptional regulator with XRE-family HTH domain